MTLGAKEYFDQFYPKRKTKKNRISIKQAEALAKQFALESCFRDGVYSARCSESGPAFIGTLADYLGMKEGDDIFFFKDRMIYGIGKLIVLSECDCRFRVHPRSGNADDLVTVNDPSVHPFVCVFRPAPFFFKKGVDMDEVLTLNPEKMKSLRFFSQRTFMKLDDFESKEIRNAIARKNEDYLAAFNEEYHYEFSEGIHKSIEDKLNDCYDQYELSVFDYIHDDCSQKVTSEYYIEGAIMDLLRGYESSYIGKMDFIGRQYPASPPKPSEYEEAMDLFGYRYVPGFPDAISKYVVIELKVGTIVLDHVQQTMKYVDWISREYAKGDYSMIEAYTIGFDKEDDIEKKSESIVERNYIVENRPVKNDKWNQLRIISYCQLLSELKKKKSIDEHE